MARAALKWTTRTLAEKAGVTQMTLNRFENDKNYHSSTEKKIRQTLEATGKIRFIDHGVIVID